MQKCLEQNMYLLSEDNSYKHFKRIIDPDNIKTLISFKDSDRQIQRFIADVQNLNRFHIDGTFTLNIVYITNNEIEDETISYRGFLYLENVAMNFRCSKDNNTITFYKINRNKRVDVTDENIHRDDLKELIEDIKIIGNKYFT